MKIPVIFRNISVVILFVGREGNCKSRMKIMNLAS